MEQQTVKTMTNEQLIGACVWLDREQKKSLAMMNSYKAELQARGLAIMEDHNVKYVKFYGDEGSAAITRQQRNVFLLIEELCRRIFSSP